MTATYQSQELWKALSGLPLEVWKDTSTRSRDSVPWREMAQLLCGAAWHFELAEKIQIPFPSETIDIIVNKKRYERRRQYGL